MADRGTFTPLHPTTRKYVAGAVREPLPERVRELVERLHDAEPITEREGTPRTGEQMRPRAPLAAARTGLVVAGLQGRINRSVAVTLKS